MVSFKERLAKSGKATEWVFNLTPEREEEMSKMSQLHAELSEQAHELGFEDLGEAEQAGYGVDWEKRKILSPQELAHKEWLEERKQVLYELNLVLEDVDLDDVDRVQHAINFLEKGEM